MVDSYLGKMTFHQLIDAGQLEIGDGYRAQNNELGGSGPIFLRSGHVTESHIDFVGVERFQIHLTEKVRSKMSQLGDTIVTTKGNSTGRTAFVTERLPSFVYSPHLSYWRSRNPQKLCNGFLRYWSQGNEFIRQLTGMKASTDMAPYLSLTDQRRLTITLPPIAEQNAIAKILGVLDEKIETNRLMNATLEAMTRAFFQSWFIDFDPVRAKSEGRMPVGMDAATARLIPSGFADSSIGKLPKGWRAGTLADCASISKATIDPGDHPDEEFQHFSLPSFDAGQYPTIEKGREIKSNKFSIPTSALLLSKLNPRIPRVWIPDLSGATQPVCSTEFIVLQPKLADGGKEHLYGIITSSDFLQSMASRVTGTSGSHQRVRPDDCMAIGCVIPDQLVIRHFSDIAKPMMQRMASNRREMQFLKITRDTLLPKLLSGEVSVAKFEGASNV